MKISNLENIISYTFKDKTILNKALTHSSFSNEHKTESYEKLEFLGDAVLELIISDLLIKTYPNVDEGELTKARSRLVRAEILASIAREIKLGNFIKLGKGEKTSNGNYKDSIIGSSLEALIAGIYIDNGYKKAFSVVSKLWKEYVDKVFIDEKLDLDYKTKLQELSQRVYKILPKYELLSEKNGKFQVRVSIGTSLITTAINKNKKKAEQLGAKEAISLIEGLK